ncbi:MAG TPA: hypothetical protein VFI65_33425 [Streptosporangiaceae bacterium]|nr:hypothetical protein [Streptosporangiaceae bacterium]
MEPTVQEAPAQGAGYDLIARTLLACEVERLSGVLKVTGEPGGLIHLTDGNVTAIETAGAPGPDLILVRSGRISEASWADAFTAAAAGGRMGSELVARGLIGEGELEAVLRTALADAMFAVAGGRADETTIEQAATPSLLPLEQPAAPGWLLFETSRRLAVLACAADLVRHDQDRVTADQAAPAAEGGNLPPGQDEILALANGRRTARDMAFILGRGVYSLSLELTRMNANGLVRITSRRAIGPARARTAPRPSKVLAPDEERTAKTNDLPRRHQPGRQPRSAPAEIMPPPSSALHRLLRLFPTGDRSVLAREEGGGHSGGPLPTSDFSGPADAGAEM